MAIKTKVKRASLACLAAAMLALPLLSQTGNGPWGSDMSSTPILANVVLSPTPANAVPPFLIGMSEPSTDVYLYYPRHTNCGSAVTGQPRCTVPPASLSTEVLPTLLSQWTSNSFASSTGTVQNRILVNRIEMDPQPGYDYTCYNVPVGTPITGNLSTNLTWSTTSGVTTFYVNSAAGIPTGPFYIHSFAPADGFNNPSTPASVTTPYTVGTSGGSGTAYFFTVTTSASNGTGTDIGYWTLQSQWFGYYTAAPTCATGSLFPPTSALVDPVIGFIQTVPNSRVSVATDLASSQTCGGNRFGPVVGVGTFTGIPYAIGGCNPTENIRQWNTALTSAAPKFDVNGVGVNYGPSGTNQIFAYELGNEPDNYTSQSQTNAWLYRPTTYSVYSNALTQAWPSSPGSGQTPGTYGVADTSAHTGTDAVVAVVVNADGTCHAGSASFTATTFTISSISRSSNTVTAVTSVASNLGVGSLISVSGVADTSYNGTFTVTSSSGTTLQWAQTGANSSSSGGTLAIPVTPGTNYYNNVTPTQPLFVLPSGGTPCTVLGQSESWMSDFLEAQEDMANNGITPALGWFNPSAATNAYRPQFSGASGNVTCDPAAVAGGGCPGGVLVAPNELNLMSPAVGTGLLAFSQHDYPYGKQNFCPAYSIASLSRVGSTLPATSTTIITLAQPTNFQTRMASTTASYPSGTGLLAFTVSDLDIVTSYTAVNGVGGTNSVVTVQTSTTPNAMVGQILQLNGAGVDATTAGAPLQVISVGASSYVATWPGFADTASVTCASNCFDQLQIYPGATGTTSGFTGNTSFNLTGLHVAFASASAATTAEKTHPYVVTLSTTVGSPTSGTDTSGGILMLTGMDAVNITDTPIGSNGTSFDLVPSISCPNGSGNPYVYPPLTAAGNRPPYCGLHASGYQSSNFNQTGTASTLTCSSSVSCTLQQQGSADTTTGGVLTLVSGLASNATINVPKNPICNPQDLLTLPTADTKVAALDPESIELKGLSIGTYSGGGALSSPIQVRTGEHNSMSPGQHLLSDTIQQSLYILADALYQGTFNGVSGTLAATGLASPASTFPFSGLDGEQFFTGNSNSYSMWLWTFTPQCTTGPSGVCINTLQDLTSNTGPAVPGAYYGMWMTFACLGSPGTGGNPTSWLPVSGNSEVPGLTAVGVQNSTANDGDQHLCIDNQAEAASGTMVVSTTGTTAAKLIVLSLPDVTNPTVQTSGIAESISATITNVVGQVVTFSVPCVAQPSTTFSGINLMYNMPLYLTGLSGSGIPNQWVTVSTTGHVKPNASCSSPTASFQATVTGSPSNTGLSGTAYEGCPLATTTPWFCTWGANISGLTWDGSYSGVPLGTFAPLVSNVSTGFTESGGVYNVPISPLSAYVLDAH